MEFRDALKGLRGELGITQVELATALHVNLTTVSRWELGKTFPSRAFVSALLEYAGEQGASARSVAALRESARAAVKRKLELTGSGLCAVEHASLRQLIDDASFPIYVCDMKTDELLYMNARAEALIGRKLDELSDKRCFACLMGRETPCESCRKQELERSKFVGFDALRPADGTYYRVQGKRIRWNGRDAHVHYATAMENGAADGRDMLPSDNVVERLLGVEYETVVTIDADTGAGQQYIGHDIDEALGMQKLMNDNALGIEAAVRGSCSEDEAKRVIRETSLPYVKRQLETRNAYSVVYSRRMEGGVVCKRVVYAYLDDTKSVILCGMQDVTDVYRKLEAQFK